MLVIAQWYNCSITSFFLLKMRLKILKNDCNQIQIWVFEKGFHFGEHFYSSSEQVSNPKIIEQRLLPKLTFLWFEW